MTAFLQVCLYVFAVCAALCLLDGAIVVAAATRRPRLVAYVLAVAGFVTFVLISAAGRLR